MTTCTQTVICQCSTLVCLICRKMKWYFVFIMSSTLLYIVLGILVMINIRPKHIRIWTILDILAVCAIFQFLITWFTYEFFCLLSLYHFDNALVTAGMVKFCFMNITQLYWGKLFAWQHVQTDPYFFASFSSLLSCTLFFVISLWYLSLWGWHCFCPAISAIDWIFHHIFYVCMKLCLHICYLYHFFIFVYLLPSYM